MEKTFLKSFIRIVATFNNSPSVTVYNFLLQGPPRTRDAHTCYRAFSSEAVTTHIYDLCLSMLGFEPNPPKARRTQTHCATGRKH